MLCTLGAVRYMSPLEPSEERDRTREGGVWAPEEAE